MAAITRQEIFLVLISDGAATNRQVAGSVPDGVIEMFQ
jgi:hypothetical protein